MAAPTSIPYGILFLLLFFLNPSLTSANNSKSTTRSCATSFNTVKPYWVPTSLSTRTITKSTAQTTTRYPTVTITPKAITRTSVIYKTATRISTLSQVTGTYSTTLTNTQTTTQIVTESITSTLTTTLTTTTTIASTVTIEPPPGFVPASATLPAKRDLEVSSRNARYIFNRGEPASIYTIKNKKSAYEKPRPSYPVKVTCITTIIIHRRSTKTVTGKTKSVTAVPRTVITTSVGTKTITRTTRLADASTTLTFTVSTTVPTTITESTTVLQTSTTVVTIEIPKETYYAACAPENGSGPKADGRNIAAVGMDRVSNSFPANSAYECCALCMSDPACAGSFWLGRPGSSCYVYHTSDGSCNPSAPAFTYYYYTSPLSGGAPWVVTSGNCGRPRDTTAGGLG